MHAVDKQRMKPANMLGFFVDAQAGAVDKECHSGQRNKLNFLLSCRNKIIKKTNAVKLYTLFFQQSDWIPSLLLCFTLP